MKPPPCRIRLSNWCRPPFLRLSPRRSNDQRDPLPAFGRARESGEGIHRTNNPDPSAANVSGWKFTKRNRLHHSQWHDDSGQRIPGDRGESDDISEHLSGRINVVGNWTGSLSNNSEESALKIRRRHPGLRYLCGLRRLGHAGAGISFWGLGLGQRGQRRRRSLELRNPGLDHQCGQNWGDSAVIGGTPGATNSIKSPNIAPMITEISHWPAIPTSADGVTISCKLTDEGTADSLTATVFWRIASTQNPGSFQSTGDDRRWRRKLLCPGPPRRI